MVNLNIKVPSKYRLLPGYRIRRNIPENWQEVTKKQLLGYCRAQRLAESDAQLRILAARYMLSLPWWLFYIINKFMLARVTYELRWLLTEPLMDNKLPRLRVRTTNLYGPDSHFANVRFAEFSVACTYYQAYMDSQSIDVLDYLIATIYRPKADNARPDSPDKRIPFEQHHLSERVRIVRRLSAEKKLAVLMYFAGCMAELALRYPLLFSGGGTNARDVIGSARPSSDWLDFIRHLPADKFGSLEHIENSLIHPVMEVANRMMADAKKEKARQKRHNAKF